MGINDDEQRKGGILGEKSSTINGRMNTDYNEYSISKIEFTKNKYYKAQTNVTWKD